MSGPGEGGVLRGGAAPGWYPDPDDAPGLVRWWSGLGWSDLTTPAGPGVVVQTPQGWPNTPQPTHQPTSQPPPRSSPAEAWTPVPGPPGSRTPWLIGLGVLGLVLVVVLGLVVANSGGDDAGPAAVAVPTTPPGQTFAPGTVRIIDQAAGISYPYLGNGWYEFDLGLQEEMAAVAGQYFTTQEQVPSGGIFIAQCTSGPVVDLYGWAGPASLAGTTTALADSVRANYYPAPNERRVLREESLTVDGAAGYLLEFDLSWDVAGYDSSGERAALLLIDVGRPAPALLYLSIPNTHAELYGVIDQVLGDVDVL